MYNIDFYTQLPVDVFLRFYHEIMKKIESDGFTKNLYHELGLIISVADQRGITLNDGTI